MVTARQSPLQQADHSGPRLVGTLSPFKRRAIKVGAQRLFASATWLFRSPNENEKSSWFQVLRSYMGLGLHATCTNLSYRLCCHLRRQQHYLAPIPARFRHPRNTERPWRPFLMPTATSSWAGVSEGPDARYNYGNSCSAVVLGGNIALSNRQEPKCGFWLVSHHREDTSQRTYP